MPAAARAIDERREAARIPAVIEPSVMDPVGGPARGQRATHGPSSAAPGPAQRPPHKCHGAGTLTLISVNSARVTPRAMMLLLLLLLAVFTAFAVAVEVLNLIAPDFVAGLHRDAPLKDSIARTQKEVAESEKRIQALRATLRGMHGELNRAADGLEKLDEQFDERRRVNPVLVFPITSTKATRRFRASVAKALPPDPEESQTLIWASPAFVEVEADRVDDAHDAARRQFPSQQGYTIGEFEEIAAAPGEAAA